MSRSKGIRSNLILLHIHYQLGSELFLQKNVSPKKIRLFYNWTHPDERISINDQYVSKTLAIHQSLAIKTFSCTTFAEMQVTMILVICVLSLLKRIFNFWPPLKGMHFIAGSFLPNADLHLLHREVFFDKHQQKLQSCSTYGLTHNLNWKPKWS